MDADAKKKAVMDAVHMNFKPEFLNRLDEIVMFHPLTREELGGIVNIQVAQVASRLTDRRIKLDVTDAAREWLANTGYDPAYGARPLRRLVQTEVATSWRACCSPARYTTATPCSSTRPVASIWNSVPCPRIRMPAPIPTSRSKTSPKTSDGRVMAA